MSTVRSPLVIGISSRALFDLEAENAIYENQGLKAYSEYTRAHENEILRPGSGFELVRAFLKLNELTADRLVDVIIISRNSADTGLRVLNSVEEYGLDIQRSAFVSGMPVTPYLDAYRTDLFLSAYEQDVYEAVNNGRAAGMLLPGHVGYRSKNPGQIRIAFDGDAVLFGAKSERIYKQEGLEAFSRHEKENAGIPMPEGPFAPFLRTLTTVQAMFTEWEECPIRTALVTARSAPAHKRAILTLREWNVRVDETFFLGGNAKKNVLDAFGADIFFDDQRVHADPASEVVASALVPYRETDDPGKTED